jgi:hypothetical protein
MDDAQLDALMSQMPPGYGLADVARPDLTHFEPSCSESS